MAPNSIELQSEKEFPHLFQRIKKEKRSRLDSNSLIAQLFQRGWALNQIWGPA